MKITNTNIEDCFLVEPQILGDHRGYFFESFNQKKFFDQTGISINIIQENQSLSKKGVLRGLHFQIGDYAQSKIVRVLQGEVLDVVVDLRQGSPTFGNHLKELLTAENKKQIHIPKGCAHGFLILSEKAEFFYCVDNHYSPENERGIMYNDPFFNLDWPDQKQMVLSDRDKNWPLYQSNQPYFE